MTGKRLTRRKLQTNAISPDRVIVATFVQLRLILGRAMKSAANAPRAQVRPTTAPEEKRASPLRVAP